MKDLKFDEQDKQKFIEFLNVVAKDARFNFNTSDVINYFKLLQHMQMHILPKIDANIFEVKKISEPALQEQEVKQETKKSKK